MVDRVKGVEKVTDNPFLNLYNFDVEKRNGKALLPIVVFVVLYLGLGILFEYVLDIEIGFYIIRERRIQRSLKQQLIKIHLMV